MDQRENGREQQADSQPQTVCLWIGFCVLHHIPTRHPLSIRKQCGFVDTEMPDKSRMSGWDKCFQLMISRHNRWVVVHAGPLRTRRVPKMYTARRGGRVSCCNSVSEGIVSNSINSSFFRSLRPSDRTPRVADASCQLYPVIRTSKVMISRIRESWKQGNGGREGDEEKRYVH